VNQSDEPTLVVGQLSIESSRTDEDERPASGTADTVQFWITSTRRWKIRTFAVDHDVLAYDLGDLGTARHRPVEFAVEHIAKHYEEILRSTKIIELRDPRVRDESARALSAHGLGGLLQRCQAGDAEIWLWSPDGEQYGTKNGD
jgi:hypothetical protein